MEEFIFQSWKQMERDFFNGENIRVDSHGLHLPVGKWRHREGKLLARNHTANQQQMEDLNSALSEVTAPVPNPDTIWLTLVVMERSGAWPCTENGNMSHQPSPGMTGEGEELSSGAECSARC